MRNVVKKHMKKEKLPAIIIFVVVMICATSFFGVGARLKYDFGETEVNVTCKAYQVTITYENVKALELVTVHDYGLTTDGGTDSSYRWGEWENEAWGKYTQCTTMNTDFGILLETNDGMMYLLNYEGDRSTEELYELFLGLLESKGYTIE